MPEGGRLCLLLLLLSVLTWRSQASLAPRFWFEDAGGGGVRVHVDGTQESVPLDGRRPGPVLHWVFQSGSTSPPLRSLRLSQELAHARLQRLLPVGNRTGAFSTSRR